MFKKALKISAWVLLATFIILCLQAWHELSTLSRMTGQGFTPFKVSPTGASDIPEESSAAASYLQKGDWHFEKGEYDKAIQNYRLLQQSEGASSHLVEMSEWHECLALYHLNGASDPSFRQLLDNLSKQRAHQYQHKALDLKDQLDHFLVGLLKG